MAVLQGRVVGVRPDPACLYTDLKYTSVPFPSRGPHRVCFVIAVERAEQRTFGFAQNPK